MNLLTHTALTPASSTLALPAFVQSSVVATVSLSTADPTHRTVHCLRRHVALVQASAASWRNRALFIEVAVHPGAKDTPDGHRD